MKAHGDVWWPLERAAAVRGILACTEASRVKQSQLAVRLKLSKLAVHFQTPSVQETRLVSTDTAQSTGSITTERISEDAVSDTTGAARQDKWRNLTAETLPKPATGPRPLYKDPSAAPVLRVRTYVRTV